MTLPEALAVLGVELPCNAKDAAKAFRRRALETHPDRGGDPAEFRRVVEALKVAKAGLDSAFRNARAEREAPRRPAGARPRPRPRGEPPFGATPGGPFHRAFDEFVTNDWSGPDDLHYDPDTGDLMWRRVARERMTKRRFPGGAEIRIALNVQETATITPRGLGQVIAEGMREYIKENPPPPRTWPKFPEGRSVGQPGSAWTRPKKAT